VRENVNDRSDQTDNDTGDREGPSRGSNGNAAARRRAEKRQARAKGDAGSQLRGAFGKPSGRNIHGSINYAGGGRAKPDLLKLGRALAGAKENQHDRF
jgi:hypothetical protein